MTREEAKRRLLDIERCTPIHTREDARDFEALETAIEALSVEPCREADDYENEIADLHNRLDIAEYDKERLREEVTALEEKLKSLSVEPCEDATLKDIFCMGCEYKEQEPCEDAISRQSVIDTTVCEGISCDECSFNTLENGESGCLLSERVTRLPSVTPKQKMWRWIPVSERLPETDNENNINNFDVLLWVRNKTHPEREPQIYLGKLRHVDGDDGSGNFWGIETKPCEWTIWGWSYFNEPEVIAWMPLPEPYKAESEDDKE